MARINTSSNDAKAPDAEFLEKARERFKVAKEFWDKVYGPAKEDLNFFKGDQWPATIEAQRNTPGEGARPTLTINRLPQFHNQIVNDYRQATISMRAVPQGVEDDNVAKTYQGIFRQVEKHSNAQVAYIKALSDASLHGLGYIRVLTEYANDESFDQDIYIRRVTNPFNHYPDPNAEGFFFEDGEFHFVVAPLRRTEYDELYGKEEDAEDFEDFDFDAADAEWFSDDLITVAEYFYFEYEYKTLIQLESGEIGFKDEIGAGKIARQRKVPVKTLCWAKIDGQRVLEKQKLGTKRIPIIPVWGNELWVGEQRTTTGFVRNAMDSCRMYNYWQSAKAEMIALAPKAPYIAAEGQMEGHEEEWKSANKTARAVLIYKPVSVDGHLVGAPQRQSYEAPVQAIIQASMQAADDIKSTIGIYDASLGAKGNETSGIAIQRRQKEGDTATYNYVDNLALSIGYTAQVVAELIPITYDTERTLQILGDDDALSTVTVNSEEQNSPQIASVKYDLILDTGPSLSSQREETARALTELSHNYPKLMEIAGDIAIGSMSFTGAREIAARLKRTIPPEVVGPNEDPVTKLHAAEQQLQQGKQLIEQLQAGIEKLQADNAEMELELKNKSGEIAVKKEEVAIKRTEMRARLAEMSRNEENGEQSAESLAGVTEIIIQLGAQVEALQEMMLAALAEEDAGDDTPAPQPEPTPRPTETTNDA